MALRPIVIAPDPVLRAVADPVETFDAELEALAADMLETMYDAPGIGLAAVQIGLLKRLVVIDIADKEEPRKPIELVNPVIEWQSDETSVFEEGCLSLPQFFGDVERPAAVKVSYQDLTGAAAEIEAEGLLATVLQHEIDHLNGILFIDHLSKLKRDMILRKLAKLKKQKAAESS